MSGSLFVKLQQWMTYFDYNIKNDIRADSCRNVTKCFPLYLRIWNVQICHLSPFAFLPYREFVGSLHLVHIS